MAIKKQKNGYLVDIYTYHTGTRKRLRKAFPTRDEARNFEADVIKARKEKTNRTAFGQSTKTIQALSSEYFASHSFTGLRPRSQVRYRELIGQFTKWCQNNNIKYVHNFTRVSASKYISFIESKHEGKGKQHALVVAKMLFSIELESDSPCISRNPFPKKSPFKTKTYSPIAISESIYRQLCEHMSEFEQSVFNIMYYTGCRSGELLFLCWAQVSETDVKYERHSYFDKKSKKRITWESKTENDRTIPLNESSMNAFNYLRILSGTEEMVLPDFCRDKSHWLTRTFEKIKKLTVNTYPELQGTLFSKDKDRNITPKRLRSTFITRLAQVTGDAVIAQTAAGHKSLLTTQKHYLDTKYFDMSDGIQKLNLN